MRIEYHPEATSELWKSAEWYEQQNPQIAREFVVAVDETVSNIAANPERFARVDETHRVCVTPRFPFQIIYRYDEERLVIIAVAHEKRRPRYWSERSV